MAKGHWKDSCCSRREAISEAWQSGQKILDMWANCVLKHCLSLKTIIPNFVAFFVTLGIVISCIRKLSFSVTSAKREFMPAGHCFIIHLPGGGQCPLVRDSEPIRLLEIPTSPSLYILIIIIIIYVKRRMTCHCTTEWNRFTSIMCLRQYSCGFCFWAKSYILCYQQRWIFSLRLLHDCCTSVL